LTTPIALITASGREHRVEARGLDLRMQLARQEGGEVGVVAARTPHRAGDLVARRQRGDQLVAQHAVRAQHEQLHEVPSATPSR
jgi:hypothetical protein